MFRVVNDESLYKELTPFCLTLNLFSIILKCLIRGQNKDREGQVIG